MLIFLSKRDRPRRRGDAGAAKTGEWQRWGAASLQSGLWLGRAGCRSLNGSLQFKDF